MSYDFDSTWLKGQGSSPIGTVLSFAGTATTSAANISATGTNKIVWAEIKCTRGQLITKELQYSIDGGTIYYKLGVNEWWSGAIPGLSLTQIKVKSTASTVDYEIKLWQEAADSYGQ